MTDTPEKDKLKTKELKGVKLNILGKHLTKQL
jgi:hypothetical protein